MKVGARQVGNVCEITYPAPGVELVATGGMVMVEDHQLPKERSLRKAWKLVNGAVVVDEAKAAEILAERELKPDWNGLTGYLEVSPLAKRVENDGKISPQIAFAFNYLAIVLNGTRKNEEMLKIAFQKIATTLAEGMRWLTTAELAFINEGLAQNRFKWKLNAVTTPLNLDRVVTVSILPR